MNDKEINAVNESSEEAGRFLNKLVKIADKYGLDRNDFIHKNALVFFKMAVMGNYTNYKITEGEGTNNE